MWRKFYGMKSWSREDTRKWIGSLETRISDIDHFLEQTLRWCEQNDVVETRRVAACCIFTCIWVSAMRGESITYTELMEILDLNVVGEFDDKIYNFGDDFKGVDLETMLTIVSQMELDF